MILFTKIRYKNFLSTGNIFTEIDLTSVPNTLIVGKNGSGKSTLIEALTFCLYGKPFRKINKNQLINSTNKKDSLVEVEFSMGDNHYLVRRGIKPNTFEIYCNDVLVDQNASVKDYQTYFEENILRMNHKSFTQIVTVGTATFIPFMQMPAKSRREIIEDLLDLEIFSTMNILVKDKISKCKEDIVDIEKNIGILENKLEYAQKHNDSIRNIHEDEVNKIKHKMQNEISKAKNEKVKLDSLKEELQNSVEDIPDPSPLEDRIQKYKQAIIQLESKKKEKYKEIEFYRDHDTCPTCRQDLEPEFKRKISSNCDDEYVKIDLKIQDGKKRVQKLSEELSEIYERKRVEIEPIKDKINECKFNIDTCHKIYDELKRDLVETKNKETKGTLENTDNIEKELQENNTSLGKLKDRLEVLTTSATMLKDSGIKSQIIKQYIPVINTLINKFLSAMDLYVEFELDETFNETIKSRFRDGFSYNSFSEGEKSRIDLALLLTWREVAKMRNSMSTNLLFLDEVFDGSLDVEGVTNLMEILSSIDTNSNIFVISHNTENMFEAFDRVLEFTKIKGFSTVETVR